MTGSKLRPGVVLFNQGRFFEAHEALEELWVKARGRRKRFLQALIQVAVAMHHYAKGNREGAGSLLARAQEKLKEYPAGYAGVDVKGLRSALEGWRKALTKREPAPRYPRLRPAAGATIRRA